MGYPRIIYGTNTDQIVDFTEYLHEGSGVVPATKLNEDQADSGIETSYYFFDRDMLNMIFKALTPGVVAQLERFRNYAKDGSTFTVEFDRALSAFFAFEGESLESNDGVDGTFSHTNVDNARSYLDYAGTLQFLNTSNVSRFVPGKFGRGILVEDARTNLIGYSKTLTTANWTGSSNATGTLTTDTLDVAGGNSAYELAATADGGYFQYNTSTAVGSDDAVFSIWLKVASGTLSCEVGVGGTTGDFVTSSVTVTTEWQRFQFYIDNGDDSPATNWAGGVTFTTNGDTCYACFAQLEAGTNIKSASNYIESDAGSTVTRGTENLIYSSLDELVLPTYMPKFTVGFWFKPQWIYNLHPAANLLQIGADATDSFLLIYVDTSGNIATLMDQGDSTFGISESTAGSSIVQNQWHHLCVTCDVTISNGLNCYLDGTLLHNSTNDPFNPISTGNKLSIGSGAAGALPAFCAFDEVFLTKEVWNNTAVKNLATQNQSSYFGRNRLTCKLKNKDFPIVPKFGGVYEVPISSKEVLT